MNSLEFKFTLSLARKYEEADSYFQRIADCYVLDMESYPASYYDEILQTDVSCISVIFSRELRKFQSAYNLLKILEASLSLFSDTAGSNIVDKTFSVS